MNSFYPNSLSNFLGSHQISIPVLFVSYSFTYLSNVKIYPLLFCAAERDKLIKVKAYIKTESGSAVIRLRMNGKVLEYTPDTDGRFEREFNFQNGGNYIMIDFDRFTGTVQMTAEYV